MSSAWKILPVTACSPEITHLNTLNRVFLTVSVFGHLEFACTGGVHQNLDMEFLKTWFSGREISVLGRTGYGFPRPKPGNFLDMIFKTWDPQFLETWSLHSRFPRLKKTWEILGYGFQDLGFQLWSLGNFRIWFSGHGFQDLGSQLWGLGNFKIWFSGHGFQDLGSQLWGLDFHTRGFQDWNLKTFRTWFSGCGISILGPGFHTGGFTVAFGHGHPLV